MTSGRFVNFNIIYIVYKVVTVISNTSQVNMCIYY